MHVSMAVWHSWHVCQWHCLQNFVALDLQIMHWSWSGAGNNDLSSFLNCGTACLAAIRSRVTAASSCANLELSAILSKIGIIGSMWNCMTGHLRSDARSQIALEISSEALEIDDTLSNQGMVSCLAHMLQNAPRRLQMARTRQ